MTGRLYNQLRELARATAIALAMSTKAVDDDTGAQQPTATSNEGQLTAEQLGIVLAKLLQCTPDNPSVTRLLQVAYADPEVDEDVASVVISMDAIVSLDDLFHQVHVDGR